MKAVTKASTTGAGKAFPPMSQSSFQDRGRACPTERLGDVPKAVGNLLPGVPLEGEVLAAEHHTGRCRRALRIAEEVELLSGHNCGENFCAAL